MTKAGATHSREGAATGRGVGVATACATIRCTSLGGELVLGGADHCFRDQAGHVFPGEALLGGSLHRILNHLPDLQRAGTFRHRGLYGPLHQGLQVCLRDGLLCVARLLGQGLLYGLF